MKAFDQQLKRGTLEMLILHLLAEERSYGYQLAATLAERSDGWFSIQEGTLYPILYRLEDAGWIVPEWTSRERGVPRKYYRLTLRGTQRLAELSSTWRTFSTAVETVLGTPRPASIIQEKERP